VVNLYAKYILPRLIDLVMRSKADAADRARRGAWRWVALLGNVCLVPPRPTWARKPRSLNPPMRAWSGACARPVSCSLSAPAGSPASAAGRHLLRLSHNPATETLYADITLRLTTW